MSVCQAPADIRLTIDCCRVVDQSHGNDESPRRYQRQKEKRLERETNANKAAAGMDAGGVVVRHLVVCCCACRELFAADATNLDSSEPIEKPLTRDDVELLLREARTRSDWPTRRSGRPDQARRDSRIHYPLLHFGATPPPSVRMEQDPRIPPRKRAASQDNSLGREKGEPLIRSWHVANPRPASAGNIRAYWCADATATGPGRRRREPIHRGRPARYAVAARFLGRCPRRRRPRLRLHQPPTPKTAVQAPSPTARLPEAPLPQRERSASRWRVRRTACCRRDARRIAQHRRRRIPPTRATKEQVLNQLTEARRGARRREFGPGRKPVARPPRRPVPETQFSPGEDRPSLVAWDVAWRSKPRAAGEPARIARAESGRHS